LCLLLSLLLSLTPLCSGLTGRREITALRRFCCRCRTSLRQQNRAGIQFENFIFIDFFKLSYQGFLLRFVHSHPVAKGAQNRFGLLVNLLPIGNRPRQRHLGIFIFNRNCNFG
jgi:hypothetical protein